MTGHDNAYTISDHQLRRTIDLALNNRVMERKPKPSIRIANDVLAFFVENAAMLPDLSEAYLLRVLDWAQTRPDDWQALARSEFRQHERVIILPPIPTIEPPTRPIPKALRNSIVHGDFLTECHKVPDRSVDLVLTSPPYAEQRKKLYASIPEHKYPEFTAWWMREVRRMLKPKGNVAINIRPHIKDGRVVSYVRYTLEWLEQDGWNYCDEWVWIKGDAPSLGHNRRPRRAWESIHWFSLAKNSFCNPRATGPQSDRIGWRGKKGSGEQFRSVQNDLQSGRSRATDVIIANVSGVDRHDYNTHPAQFPPRLAETVIQLLCPPGGTVLDPFVGSGTTAVAAVNTQRNHIGFEKQGKYVNIARLRLKESKRENPDETFHKR